MSVPIAFSSDSICETIWRMSFDPAEAVSELVLAASGTDLTGAGGATVSLFPGEAEWDLPTVSPGFVGAASPFEGIVWSPVGAGRGGPTFRASQPPTAPHSPPQMTPRTSAWLDSITITLVGVATIWFQST